MKNRHKILDEISKHISRLARILEQSEGRYGNKYDLIVSKRLLISAHDELSKLPDIMERCREDYDQAKILSSFTEIWQEVTNITGMPDLKDKQTENYSDFFLAGIAFAESKLEERLLGINEENEREKLMQDVYATEDYLFDK